MAQMEGPLLEIKHKFKDLDKFKFKDSKKRKRSDFKEDSSSSSPNDYMSVQEQQQMQLDANLMQQLSLQPNSGQDSPNQLYKEEEDAFALWRTRFSNNPK